MVVYEEYPPYEYTDENGKLTGVNIELLLEACRRLNIDPVFRQRPWNRAIMEIQTGEADAIMSLFDTEERRTFIEFPEIGLANEVNALFALRETGITAHNLAEAANHVIGVIKGYAYGEPFDSSSGIRKNESLLHEQLIEKFLNKRVNIIVENVLGMAEYARRGGFEDEYVQLFELSSEPLFIGFSKVDEVRAKSLASRFTHALGAMRKDGTTAKIEARYLGDTN